MAKSDSIKVALTERRIGQCYLTISPPAKLRALGWAPFERGPFPRSRVQQAMSSQGPTLQYMVCALLDCTQDEIDAGYVDFESIVEFSRPETEPHELRCNPSA
jgi:hypothetical protein